MTECFDGIKVSGEFNRENCDGNIIYNNTIEKSNGYGIFLDWASYNNISYNHINDYIDHEIYIYRGSNTNKIVNNTILESDIGILTDTSENNFIINNTVRDNRNNGIQLNTF